MGVIVSPCVATPPVTLPAGGEKVKRLRLRYITQVEIVSDETMYFALGCHLARVAPPQNEDKVKVKFLHAGPISCRVICRNPSVR